MGILSIVLSYKIPLWGVSLIALGIVIVYTTILVAVLGTQYKKLYFNTQFIFAFNLFIGRCYLRGYGVI